MKSVRRKEARKAFPFSLHWNTSIRIASTVTLPSISQQSWFFCPHAPWRGFVLVFPNGKELTGLPLYTLVPSGMSTAHSLGRTEIWFVQPVKPKCKRCSVSWVAVGSLACWCLQRPDPRQSYHGSTLCIINTVTFPHIKFQAQLQKQGPLFMPTKNGNGVTPVFRKSPHKISRYSDRRRHQTVFWAPLWAEITVCFASVEFGLGRLVYGFPLFRFVSLNVSLAFKLLV